MYWAEKGANYRLFQRSTQRFCDCVETGNEP